MVVRKRISHYTIKNIPVPKQEISGPRIFKSLPDVVSNKKLLSIRREIVLSARNIRITVEVDTEPKTKRNSSINKSAVKKSKSTIERQSLKSESTYAVKPKRQFSEIIREQIRLEVALFRKNGAQKATGGTGRIGRSDCGGFKQR